MPYIPFKRVVKWLFLLVVAREVLGLLPPVPLLVSALLHSTTLVLLAKGAVAVLGTALIWWLILNGSRGVLVAAREGIEAAWKRWFGRRSQA